MFHVDVGTTSWKNGKGIFPKCKVSMYRCDRASDSAVITPNFNIECLVLWKNAQLRSSGHFYSAVSSFSPPIFFCFSFYDAILCFSSPVVSNASCHSTTSISTSTSILPHLCLFWWMLWEHWAFKVTVKQTKIIHSQPWLYQTLIIGPTPHFYLARKCTGPESVSQKTGVFSITVGPLAVISRSPKWIRC